MAKKTDITSKINIKPLFDNVLIKPLQAEERTAGGIILPDTVREKPQIGEVMAIGDGAFDEGGKRMPMGVKLRQKVMYKKWGGNEVKVNGQDWILVEQKDILAVLG